MWKGKKVNSEVPKSVSEYRKDLEWTRRDLNGKQ